MKIKKFLIALLAIVAVVSLAACGKEKVNYDADEKDVAAAKSDVGVYSKVGKDIKITDVKEDEEGQATITVKGVTYTLGLDFLSMAMVYNCTPAGEFKTEEEVYNEWWRLYIQRWNYVLPEVPLYSNQYYDVFAEKISQFKTSPYWGANEAIVGATSTDGKAIIGSSTELSGLFRASSFGKSSPAASDQDVEQLTTGYATAVSDITGNYKFNEDVVAEEPTKVVNADGTLTYTIKIKQGLKDSKNQEITADYYLAATLVANTPVYGEAGGNTTGSISIVGYDKILAYNGTGDKVYFKGLKKLGDYEFAVTIDKDYANYYYAMTYAAFSPKDPAIYLCGASIVTDADGCVGLSDDFYAKETKDGKDVFKNAEVLKANINNNDATAFAYTGPYVVESYDKTTHKAELVKNQYYVTESYRKYDDNGTLKDGNITNVTYVKVVTATQTDQLKKGEVNILEGITGGSDTKAALALCEAGGYKYTYYDRAGYGKLSFKCDYGPTNFVEVRRAICYSINRNEFATAFTGGYGTVVDGPYYKGSSAYMANVDKLNISNYAYSLQKAKEELVKGGWTYYFDGEKIVNFEEGKGQIRYKKLTGSELTKANIFYRSTDNKYKTVKVNGEYYMPLSINWFGTPADENEVTALLISNWKDTKGAADLGFYITSTQGDFTIILYGEYYQMEAYGYTKGDTPICSCANFATGFNSAVYDQAYYWSIAEDFYMDYNCQMKDPADFYCDYPEPAAN